MTNPGYHDHLMNLAAIIYRSGEDDADRLLADFAVDLIGGGYRIGGIVQHNAENPCGPRDLMQLIDLTSGRAIPICQWLGNRRRSALGNRRRYHRGASPSHRRSRQVLPRLDRIYGRFWHHACVRAARGRGVVARNIVARRPRPRAGKAQTPRSRKSVFDDRRRRGNPRAVTCRP
jgi:hypothetical protein